jgi:hypothetical protein
MHSCCVRLEVGAVDSHSDFAPRTTLFRDSFVRFFKSIKRLILGLNKIANESFRIKRQYR